MVLCIIAMIIFAILGIFSAKYRIQAKKAFSCTFRMITFRPCITNFDQEMRVKIVAPLMDKHKKTARFIYKYFKVLSIIFVVLFFASLAYSSYAIYNLAVHGDCTPNNEDDQCFFNPDQPSCGPKDIPEDVICYDSECLKRNSKILNGD